MMIRDRSVYFVLVSNQHGNYAPERDESDMDRVSTINDIAEGQFHGVAQVIEFNPVERICHDVTEEIARAVADLWADDGEPLTDWRREFVEAHLGIAHANAFVMEAAE